jgi:signal transduction histidine kinase
MIDLQTLRLLSLFGEFTNEQLCWLIEHTKEVWLQPDEKFVTEGEPANYLYVLLEGELWLTKNVGGQEIYVHRYEPGTLFGEMSILLDKPYIANGRAYKKSHLLQLTKDTFWNMLTRFPSITRDLLSTMAQRLQILQSMSQQHEKFIALGTLAAGLAHELNNPAAAALRAAEQLQEAIQALSLFTLKLCQQQIIKEEKQAFITEIQNDLIKHATAAPQLDSLAQSDLEDEVITWLEIHEVLDGWKLASTLVRAGINTEWLNSFAERVSTDSLSDMLRWIDATLTGIDLLNEVKVSTVRICELVKAIKDYSYMDQAPQQEVDIHQGIQSTLTMLNFKLKGGVVVNREYDLSLPHIYAHGSQLNQVWTNLIDNAIDAIKGHGQIWIRTSRENNCVLVEIVDDGPGIPLEIQSRIFEPFFTTKDVGEGTGLGLHITYRIVAANHQGDIRVISQPGSTTFQVRLPIKQSPKIPV